MILGILLLLTGLIISAVAIYYSVLGLAAIFAAAVIPIYIMGGTLEVAKLVCASWLKANWGRAPIYIKSYMLTAVIVLMAITSMGIFGFLSKAHTDQSIVSGDANAQLALFDEKIKTQRDNIEVARKALQQMDAQVDARLSRGGTEAGAERAVQIRRQQATERTRLQREIAAAQKEIATLNEQRAPIAAQNRKIEAEVGPIKYIAKLIYGDNPDNNLLEKAVTWVIILIVIVFDPLAVVMLLAAQMTFTWIREDKKIVKLDPTLTNETLKLDPTLTNEKNKDSIESQPLKEQTSKPVIIEKETMEGNSPEKESDIVSTATVTEAAPHHPDTHPYLNAGFKFPENFERVQPLVDKFVDNKQKLDFEDSQFPPIITVDSTEVKVDEEPVEEPSKKKVHDQGTGQTGSSDQEIMYVQNQEQTENSLWKRLRERVPADFKPKDYLRVVFDKGQFEDIQYNPEQEPELDKFIKDIKNNTHSLGDYPQEELKKFAAKIYEFRKN